MQISWPPKKQFPIAYSKFLLAPSRSHYLESAALTNIPFDLLIYFFLNVISWYCSRYRMRELSLSCSEIESLETVDSLHCADPVHSMRMRGAVRDSYKCRSRRALTPSAGFTLTGLCP